MILVTGSNGLCGSAIKRLAPQDKSFYFSTRSDADLVSQNDVKKLFHKISPEIVIHCAAKVGGLGANKSFPADMFYQNIMMNTNIIKNCIEFNVKKLIVFSSVCVFPENLTLLEENKMHDGTIYDYNSAYGYSKRMSDIYIQSAIKQHRLSNYTSIIPTNIFGKNDLYDVNYGHIIPSLMIKLYDAIRNKTPLYVWGDGYSLREFIFADDLAKILLQLIDMDYPDRIIIGGRQEYSIRNVVDLLCRISNFNGQVIYESNMPNGQRSRPTSKKVIDSLVPYNYTPFEEALSISWEWFTENYEYVRTKLNHF